MNTKAKRRGRSKKRGRPRTSSPEKRREDAAERQRRRRARLAAENLQSVTLHLPANLLTAVDDEAEQRGINRAEVILGRLASEQVELPNVEFENAPQQLNKFAESMRTVAKRLTQRLRRRPKERLTNEELDTRHRAEDAAAAYLLAAATLAAAANEDSDSGETLDPKAPDPAKRVLERLLRGGKKRVTQDRVVELRLFVKQQAALRYALRRYIEYLDPVCANLSNNNLGNNNLDTKDLSTDEDYDMAIGAYSSTQLALTLWNRIPQKFEGYVCVRLNGYEARFLGLVLQWMVSKAELVGFPPYVKGAPWLEVHSLNPILAKLYGYTDAN